MRERTPSPAPVALHGPLSHQEAGVGLGHGEGCVSHLGPQLGALSESLGGPGRRPRGPTGRGRRGDVQRPSGLPLWAGGASEDARAPPSEGRVSSGPGEHAQRVGARRSERFRWDAGLAWGHEDPMAHPPPPPWSEVTWGGRPSGSRWRWAARRPRGTPARGTLVARRGAHACGSLRARGSPGLPPPPHRSSSP